MSYYSSKHPGLYLYLALVGVTLSVFLFIEVGAMQIGFLSIFWGSFTAMRALSLYEINVYFNTYAHQSTLISKEHNAQSSALAHDLIRRMTGNTNIKQGLHALYCMHERTILWFALALGYTAWYLHISAPLMSRSDLMEIVCTLFMIGATFWGGQSYAHDKKASTIMLFSFVIALCISLYSLPAGLSTINLYQALSGLSIGESATPHTLLVLLALYSVAILIYALLRRNKAVLSVLGGISLITLLSLCHLSLEPSQATTALWISGWGLFSVFWTHAYQPVNKRYVLYQCD
ncbi:MAG: hypothetical protein KAJ29_04820, partial [Alphaproteobacteria bacterium]|nr:hypothetical protein [Alphaproteobacteria bacterium]